MSVNRVYQGKDVDMLTSCATINESAIANQDFLAGKRSSWAPPYFTNLGLRIDTAFSRYLGVDNAADMRRATREVVAIEIAALADLSEVKVQIEEDFKKDKPRRDEILKTLGYTGYYKKAQKKDQEALVQVLFQYNSSLTPELFAEITAKGTDAATLERIKGYATHLSAANVTQESLKGAGKNVTDEAVTEFNAIYEQVIGIAKIARKFYKGNLSKQDEFSYAKVRSKLNAAPRNKK